MTQSAIRHGHGEQSPRSAPQPAHITHDSTGGNRWCTRSARSVSSPGPRAKGGGDLPGRGVTGQAARGRRSADLGISGALFDAPLLSERAEAWSRKHSIPAVIARDHLPHGVTRSQMLPDGFDPGPTIGRGGGVGRGWKIGTAGDRSGESSGSDKEDASDQYGSGGFEDAAQHLVWLLPGGHHLALMARRACPPATITRWGQKEQ